MSTKAAKAFGLGGTYAKGYWEGSLKAGKEGLGGLLESGRTFKLTPTVAGIGQALRSIYETPAMASTRMTQRANDESNRDFAHGSGSQPLPRVQAKMAAFGGLE